MSPGRRRHYSQTGQSQNHNQGPSHNNNNNTNNSHSNSGFHSNASHASNSNSNSNSDYGSSFYPIWALAAVSMMDHSNAATARASTSTSTSTNLSSNAHAHASTKSHSNTSRAAFRPTRHTHTGTSASTSASGSAGASSHSRVGMGGNVGTGVGGGGGLGESMQRVLYPTAKLLTSSSTFDVGKGSKSHVTSASDHYLYNHNNTHNNNTSTEINSNSSNNSYSLSNYNRNQQQLQQLQYEGGGLQEKNHCEFSQDKKWIRSGYKWVLTSNSNSNSNSNISSTVADANQNSNSSILAEIGGLLHTVQSNESGSGSGSGSGNSSAKTRFHQHGPNSNNSKTSASTGASATFNSISSPPHPSRRKSATGATSTSTTSTVTSPSSLYFQQHPHPHQNQKIHPTAVSSYGTTAINTTPRRSQARPYFANSNHTNTLNRNLNHNNISDYNLYHTNNNNNNSASSVITSSPSLVYTRRRMATTSAGFPYMPSLHLARSSSSINSKSNHHYQHGGKSSSSVVTATASGGKNNGKNDRGHGHDDPSPLHTSAPISSQKKNSLMIPTSTPVNATVNTKAATNVTKNANNMGLGVGAGIALHSLFYNSPLIQTLSSSQQQQQQQQPQHQNQQSPSSSTATTKNNTTITKSSFSTSTSSSHRHHHYHNKHKHKQRKNKKIASPPKLSYNSRAFSDSFRSIDSGYDSESNNIIERLKEWKEEQFKKSGIMVPSNNISVDVGVSVLDDDEDDIDVHVDVNDDVDDIQEDGHDCEDGHGTNDSFLLSSPLSNLKMSSKHRFLDSPLYNDNSSNNSNNNNNSSNNSNNNNNVDGGYESGSTTCDERLKEWKEQQYKISGIIRKKPMTGGSNIDGVGHLGGNVSHSIQPTSPTWDINTTRSLDSGYDSEEPQSRSERLKEWKEQFANNLPLQEHSNHAGSRSESSSGSNHNQTTTPATDVNSNEAKQTLTTIHSPHFSRHTNNASTSGFFPVTSPNRKSRRSTNHHQNTTSGTKRSTSSAGIGIPINSRSSTYTPSPSKNHPREYLSTSTNPPKHPLVISSLLPPLTPPRFTYSEHYQQQQQSNSKSKKANDDNDDKSDETNKTIQNSLLCSPTTTNIHSPCQVIPQLPSTDSTMEVDSPPSPEDLNRSTGVGSSLRLLQTADLCKPMQSQSSFSAITSGDIDSSNCSLNPHEGLFVSVKKCSLKSPMRQNSSSKETPSSSTEPLHTWENCLYVQAEGARTGRICLSRTHLIFVYEDDAADEALLENGWSRKKIEDFIQKVNGSPSPSATPINVPPDESGEGGGVELVGTDDNGVDFLDLLEDGFDKGKSVMLTEEEKENLAEDGLSFDEIKCEENKNVVSSYGLSVKYEDAQEKNSNDGTPRNSEGNDFDKIKYSQQLDNDCLFGQSSSYSSSISENSQELHSSTQDIDGAGTCPEDSLCEDSYEYMLNECIVRAMKAEAQRRVLELGGDESAAMMSTVASYSPWDKLEMNRSDINNDFGSLLGNQTNVSSFSEPDLEIDPDEERRLYITGANDSRREFVGIKWSLSKLTELYDRRYMMKEVAFEIFGPSPSRSSTLSLKRLSSAASASTAGMFSHVELDVPLGPLSKESILLVIPDNDDNDIEIDGQTFINRFGRVTKPKKRRRDILVEMLTEYAPNLNDIHWQNAKVLNQQWTAGTMASPMNDDKTADRRSWTPTSLFRRRNDKSDPLYLLMRAWRKGHISNYDYLLRLNAISGRSFHDPGNYPIMPWVLSNFVSSSVPDLSDERNYRDLSKPMGALDPQRLHKFLDKYASLCSVDYAIPPFMFGSHYSNTGGVVLHYLVRTRPFAGLHRQLQGGQFDIPDRLFRSVSQTWDICSRTSATEVKELTPEWFSDASFLKNEYDFNLGTSVDGATISDVLLPPWADNDPAKFIEVMRNSLESDYCSANLSSWIDLIFGYKQRGPEAEKANNVFYHLSYYDSEDLDKIEDKTLRTEIELHIADFGNCPSQLFFKAHPSKKSESLVSQSKGELRMMAGGSSSQKEGSISTPRRILLTHDS